MQLPAGRRNKYFFRYYEASICGYILLYCNFTHVFWDFFKQHSIRLQVNEAHEVGETFKRLVWLFSYIYNANDTDTYFENIQTILIFLKHYCCESHLKYYKILFFSWIINEEKSFLFHVSIKPVWKKHEIKKLFDCEIY